MVSCEELLKEGLKEAVVTCTTTIEEAMKNDELVSVIIPVYNVNPYISEAIEK